MIIQCKECGKDISDQAATCPHCGCPSERQEEFQELQETNAKSNRIGCAIVGIIIAIIGFALMFGGITDIMH